MHKAWHDTVTHLSADVWCTVVQDLFVGAWQQADPAVDQVPYTFPPVLASVAGKAQPKAKSKGKKSKAPLIRKTSQATKPKAKPMHDAGHLLPPQSVSTQHAAAEKLPTAVQAKGVGVSAAEYAQALYEDL